MSTRQPETDNDTKNAVKPTVHKIGLVYYVGEIFFKRSNFTTVIRKKNAIEIFSNKSPLSSTPKQQARPLDEQR